MSHKYYVQIDLESIESSALKLFNFNLIHGNSELEKKKNN